MSCLNHFVLCVNSKSLYVSFPLSYLPSSEVFRQVFITVNSSTFSIVWQLAALACPWGGPSHRLLTNTTSSGSVHLHAVWEPGEASLTTRQWQVSWPGVQRLSLSLFWSLVTSSILHHLRYKEGLADSRHGVSCLHRHPPQGSILPKV